MFLEQDNLPIAPEIADLQIPIKLAAISETGRKVTLHTCMKIVKQQRYHTEIGHLILTKFHLRTPHPWLPVNNQTIYRVTFENPKSLNLTKDELLFILQFRVFRMHSGDPIKNFIRNYKKNLKKLNKLRSH